MGSYEDFKDQASRDARKLLWYHASVKLPGEQGRFYQSDSDKPLFYKEKRRNIPDDGVPLEEGAVVKDITGKDLGKIQDVFTEPEPFKVTHILMSSGTINKTSKLIPVDWIKEISEDFVQLYLRKETFENLAGADTVITK
jgi:hypothetical protein